MSKDKPKPDEVVTFAHAGHLNFGAYEEMKFTAAEPTYTTVCVVINNLTGQPAYFDGHEPDTALEHIVWPGGGCFATLHDRNQGDDPVKGKVIGKIRFCKRCCCLYVEKPE